MAQQSESSDDNPRATKPESRVNQIVNAVVITLLIAAASTVLTMYNQQQANTSDIASLEKITQHTFQIKENLAVVENEAGWLKSSVKDLNAQLNDVRRELHEGRNYEK